MTYLASKLPGNPQTPAAINHWVRTEKLFHNRTVKALGARLNEDPQGGYGVTDPDTTETGTALLLISTAPDGDNAFRYVLTDHPADFATALNLPFDS